MHPISTFYVNRYGSYSKNLKKPPPRTKSTFFGNFEKTFFECVDLSKVQLMLVFDVCGVKKTLGSEGSTKYGQRVFGPKMDISCFAKFI